MAGIATLTMNRSRLASTSPAQTIDRTLLGFVPLTRTSATSMADLKLTLRTPYALEDQGLLNREVNPFEIDGYHLVEALLCHVFEQPKVAVTCIYQDAVEVSELPLDRGEHRVEVGEIADVRANGETSGSKRLLARLHRPLIQAADGDAPALSSKFLRCAQPDPPVPAGDRE